LAGLAESSEGLTGDRAAAASPQGLADRRELALVAVERTRMPMIIADARQHDHPIVLANQAFLALSGYNGEEVIGRNCRFLQGEGTSPLAVAQIRAALAEKRDIVVELMNYRKDGSSFWNQLSLSPICDRRGRLLYIFGSQMDVTRRHRAEELEASERRLLREVDHRAMNALALVQAIVRLTRADSVQDYVAAVQGRVAALGRAHSALADRGWTGAPFDQILRLEVEPLAGPRASFDGPRVMAPADLVQPLTLVVHEMAVNAVTHGSLSSPQGGLALRWWEQPDSGRLGLHWKETGGPAPAQVRAVGFGSTMIDAIVKRQLRGALRLDWQPQGLEAEITFPLSAWAGPRGEP